MAITVSRLGQIDAADSDQALFLKVWSGEVLTAFDEVNVFEALQLIRSISSGKSAQFPATWKATASRHTPGSELDGQEIKHGEREIFVDDPLIADVYVAEIDQLKNHYDARSIYTSQLVGALARDFDQISGRLAVKAARTASTIDDSFSGSQITLSGTTAIADVTAAELIEALFEAGQKMDEKDVPDSDRYCVLKPAQHNLLVRDRTALNKDWAGAGSFAKGTLPEINGIKLIKSNNVPQGANLTTPSGARNDYSLDATKTVMPVFHKSATGCVKRLSMTMESGWDRRRQAWHILAKYVLGHGILRPEAAVEVQLDAE